MGGFKRPNAKPKGSEAKKPRQEQATRSSRGGRGRGRGPATASRRGQKRRSDEGEEEEEEEEEVNSRKFVVYDDDDEDVQAEYREDGGTLLGDIWIPPKYAQKAHDLKGERLIIQKIVCENFKSYGGVKEMGPFHKSFSAIVGPNGNGKSNIIDAMLFVFGYRATKIRCKKMSVLIHKSELLPDVHSCAVTVHFVKVLDEGDEDKMDIVDNSNITVTRRVDRNNKSTYQLNGLVVQFHEVASFLKTSGVDIVHNRFLILQGEVESIAQMPAKRKTQHDAGLLEFLEEVIGTKRYMKCLCQLEQKVEELNSEREAKLHTVDIVEKEVKELKGPVAKAKEFLRTKNGLQRNKHKLNQVKIHATRNDMAAFEAEKKQAEDNLAKTESELEGIKGVQSEKEKELEDKATSLKSLEHKANRLQKQIDSADSQFSKNKEQIQRDNTKRKKVIKEITAGEKELEVLELIPDTARKEMNLLEKRREDLNILIEKEQETVAKEMTKVETQVGKLTKEKEELMKTFMKLKTNRDTKKEKSDMLQSELKVAKEQEEIERQKLVKVKGDLEEAESKLKQMHKDARSSFGNKAGGMEDKLRAKKGELETVTAEERLAKPEMETTRAAYEDARDIFQNSNTDDEIYKAFLAEKGKGRFEGLYGRLRDLATINEKYNVAATVASGIWDNWVVDNEVTGEQAIKFLRERNLPFQNFQCLNKLQRYLANSARPFNAPHNSHRLFDLIKISKPELASVFYKALNDTLVADNIDIGSEIAYSRDNRCSVTTLAGEIINPGGQMTGGGRHKIIGKLNGRMAAQLERSITERDYRSLKENMEAAAKKYNEVFARKQALETEVRNLAQAHRDIQGKLESSKTGLESMTKQIKLKEKLVADQEKKVKDATMDPKVIEQKEKLARKAATEFEDATEPCVNAEAEVKKVQEKLQILQGERTKEIRKKLDSSLDQRNKVIEDYNKHSVALKNYPQNQAKLVKKLENLRSEKTRLEAEMRELEESKKVLTEQGVEVAKEMERVKEELVTTKAEFQNLKKAVAEYHKKSGELDKKRVVQQNDLENSTGKYSGIAGRVAAIKKRMAELKLDEIPQETVEPFHDLTEEELDALDVQQLEQTVATVEDALKKQSPNLLVLNQYKIKLDEFMAKVSVLDGVTMERDKFRNALLTTTVQRLSEFLAGFAIISSKLKEMFRMISMGGDAELELVDSTDPFTMGINISVRPARKAWKKISHLSGGEKTLASLALIFALHHFKPSPFYVMDEIDAALDFKNVSIIANYIKDRTKFTQFIIISLRSNMFELADSMLGVFKVDNMSYSIHLGINALLTQLRDKFREAGKPLPLPLENEFQSNNRAYRQKEMEKITEEKKQKADAESLFNNNFSIMEDEDSMSQSQTQGTNPGTQAVDEAQPRDTATAETERIDISTAETQRVEGGVDQPEDTPQVGMEDAATTPKRPARRRTRTQAQRDKEDLAVKQDEDVSNKNEEDAEVTGVDEAVVTGDVEGEGTGEDNTNVSMEDEAESTAGDETESTVGDEADVSGVDEAVVAGDDEGEGAGEDNANISMEDEAESTVGDEEVSGTTGGKDNNETMEERVPDSFQEESQSASPNTTATDDSSQYESAHE